MLGRARQLFDQNVLPQAKVVLASKVGVSAVFAFVCGVDTKDRGTSHEGDLASGFGIGSIYGAERSLACRVLEPRDSDILPTG